METKPIETRMAFGMYTYPVPEHADYTVDSNLPNLPFNTSTPQLPTVNLGILSVCPLEILQEILSHLDLCSLTHFLLVNRNASQVVQHMPHYKAITTHARHVLRSILAIGSGEWITCDTLYRTITTRRCADCGDDAGFIYIFTCRRVCYFCFTQKARYIPVKANLTRQRFALSKEIVDTLPQCRSLPGVYTARKWSGDRVSLVDVEVAERAGVELHGSVEGLKNAVQVMLRRKNNLPEVDVRDIPPRQRIFQQLPLDLREGNVMRFIGVCGMGWLNEGARKVEVGVHCVGCKSMRRPGLLGGQMKHRRIFFDERAFGEHLKRVGGIENDRHSICE